MTATEPEEDRPQTETADPWAWSGSRDSTDPPPQGTGAQGQPPTALSGATAPVQAATTASKPAVRVTKKAKSSAGWPVAFLLCAAGMIAGSRGTWATVDGTTIAGIAHAGAGEVSLVGGVVLVAVTVALILLGGGVGPATRRLLGQLAAAAAGAGLGIAIYVTDHIGSDFGGHAGMGWGLILVLVSSVAALIVSIAVTVTSVD